MHAIDRGAAAPFAAMAVLMLTGLLVATPASAQSGATGAASDQKKPITVSLWQPGDPGERLSILGRVLDSSGEPVAGAVVNMWQADGTGAYQGDRYRASMHTEADGTYRFNSVIPGQYYGMKHIHLHITHDGYAPLATRILFKGDPHLDPVTERDEAIFLEQAEVEGETVFFGRFESVMRGGN